VGEKMLTMRVVREGEGAVMRVNRMTLIRGSSQLYALVRRRAWVWFVPSKPTERARRLCCARWLEGSKKPCGGGKGKQTPRAGLPLRTQLGCSRTSCVLRSALPPKLVKDGAAPLSLGLRLGG
jgi:hypothetical protein